MRATAEHIKIMNDHMIEMANYDTSELCKTKKAKFRNEVRKCRIWILRNDIKDLSSSIIETKLIQAEMDCRLSEVRDFIGI